MAERNATLYRMKLPTHECPYGLLARRMLDDAGFDVEEHLLTTREEVDDFMAKHELTTTPLIVINGEQIGGSDELAAYLEQVPQD